MSVFVDSSAWFASIVARDHHNSRAKAIMQGVREHITTDHVVVETWLLLNARFHRQAADLFWERIRIGRVQIEHVSARPISKRRGPLVKCFPIRISRSSIVRALR